MAIEMHTEECFSQADCVCDIMDSPLQLWLFTIFPPFTLLQKTDTMLCLMLYKQHD